ncbi:MAG TPA: hypothetical protein VM491_21165 [Burkholderiaceae bacterium]|nr:hypothetical protein [Burkholderiaceae bacterium]
MWINDDGLSFTIKAVTADSDGLHIITIVPTIAASPAREAVEFDAAGWHQFVLMNRLREIPDEEDDLSGMPDPADGAAASDDTNR